MKSSLNRQLPNPQARSGLRFSPTAWAKLLFLRDRATSEVGGFGITRLDDLLYVEDIQTVEQICSVVSVEFDDDAVARFFDAQVDAGRQPAQFARIWIHTHPEISARPSSTDEETFARVFGRTEWALMFILSKTDELFCRLRFNVGPGGEMEIPVAVDYRGEFAGSDLTAWEAEYQANVKLQAEWPKGRCANKRRQTAIQRPATEVQSPDGAEARLRGDLQQRFGWSPQDIDQQLECGWTLVDLVDYCRRNDESWWGVIEERPTEVSPKDDGRTEVLSPV